MIQKSMRRNLAEALLVGGGVGAVLVGIADVINLHVYQHPRGVGDILAGAIAGLLVFYMRRIKLLERDGLTGLSLRIVAEDRLSLCAARKKDISVGIIDVNGLKMINDKQGHDAGDVLLKEVGSRLASYARRHPKHTVARLGGDEFIIIAPRTNTSVLAGRIDTLIDPEHEFGDWPIAVAGVARTRNGSRDVLRCADLAMYRAKRHYYDGFPARVLSYNVTLDGMPEPPRVAAPGVVRRSRIDRHKMAVASPTERVVHR